ncbi:hypothetical protein [Variovorax sp. LG9.2]|uniref:hypothetical protein n=1 Tax=Variovorax sp. LG9.2 TaxID=3048626 RepID=UPI002B222EF5|nr:hypothetical protein [Variovorax sp. LG9.2]MEB0056477.1 hypothetical protein [Variovorax sp. LG9.2]
MARNIGPAVLFVFQVSLKGSQALPRPGFKSGFSAQELIAYILQLRSRRHPENGRQRCIALNLVDQPRRRCKVCLRDMEEIRIDRRLDRGALRDRAVHIDDVEEPGVGGKALPLEVDQMLRSLRHRRRERHRSADAQQASQDLAAVQEDGHGGFQGVSMRQRRDAAVKVARRAQERFWR